eukprot:2190715-Prymnesium_polylepis.1
MTVRRTLHPAPQERWPSETLIRIQAERADPRETSWVLRLEISLDDRTCRKPGGGNVGALSIMQREHSSTVRQQLGNARTGRDG